MKFCTAISKFFTVALLLNFILVACINYVGQSDEVSKDLPPSQILPTSVLSSVITPAMMITPALTAVITPASISFNGKISRGETFEREVLNGLIFRLEPRGHADYGQLGWDIWMGNQAKPENDFVGIVTPPYYGMNSRHIEGWHFRNSDNTGPNEVGEKNVNAPQHERRFCFVLNEEDDQIAYQGLRPELFFSSEEEQELARLKRSQLKPRAGVLTITHLALGNLVEGELAWIEDMEFEVELQISENCEMY